MSKDRGNTPLRRLITEAMIEHPCSQGHDWQTDGGRHCEAKAEGCRRSQPVYRCARCGEWDYGGRGGPGHDDCVTYCGAAA